MQVYCPNCGSENEGMSGGRVTCRACTASFEVPASTQPPAPAPPRPAGAGWVGGQPSAPAPVIPAPQGFGGPAQTTNPLAITSLVAGILCCVPFASIGAVITGFLAIGQIDRSGGGQKGKELAIAGIVLGFLSFGLGLLSVLAQLAK